LLVSSYTPRTWKLTKSKRSKIKKFRITKTHNKNTTTPKTHSRVIDAKVRLRQDVTVLATAKPTVERMTRRRYSVNLGCHERLDFDDMLIVESDRGDSGE
jgi:hypothetical protein